MLSSVKYTFQMTHLNDTLKINYDISQFNHNIISPLKKPQERASCGWLKKNWLVANVKLLAPPQNYSLRVFHSTTGIRWWLRYLSMKDFSVVNFTSLKHWKYISGDPNLVHFYSYTLQYSLQYDFFFGPTSSADQGLSYFRSSLTSEVGSKNELFWSEPLFPTPSQRINKTVLTNLMPYNYIELKVPLLLIDKVDDESE